MTDVALPKRKFPWALVVAVVAAGALAAWFFYPRAPDKPKITTAAVDRGDITVRVTATGTLSALVTVQVGSQVSGRIQAMLVDFNDTVKKGQIIARLDPQLLQAAVTEAKANNAAGVAALDRARVRAENARHQLARAQGLADNKLIAQSELEAAELDAKVADADVGTAQAQLEQARSSLERTRINLGYATIISPIDGVVISRSVDVGQTVAASLQAPTLFTIAQDLRRMQVDTSVGEADIGKITPGMNATFTVDAWPSERFVGKVKQIRNAPETVQNVVSYDVIIDVDNADQRLRPGMTANVNFTVATKGDVLRVPNAALRFRAPSSFLAALAGDKPPRHDGNGDAGGAARTAAGDEPPRDNGAHGGPHDGAHDGGTRDGGTHGGRGVDGAREVWVVRGGQPQPVRIHTGLSDGTVTELIGDALHEGDEVVTDASAGAGANGSGNGRAPRIPRRMF